MFVERSVHIGLYVVLEFESVEYKGKSSLLKFIVYTVKCLLPFFPHPANILGRVLRTNIQVHVLTIIRLLNVYLNLM